MNEKKSLSPILITAAVIALIGGLWLGTYTESKQPVTAPEIYGTWLPIAKPVTAFQLLGQHSRPFTEQNLRGNWSLIFIGYTHCPDICPTTLSVLQQTTELLLRQHAVIPKVIFVSIDPIRDTPDVLAKYVMYFNQDFVGVTGSEDELANLTRQLAAYSRKVAGASGDINNNDYLMEHSAALLLINPQAELQAFLTPPHIPAQIAESIQRSVAYYQDTQ